MMIIRLGKQLILAVLVLLPLPLFALESPAHLKMTQGMTPISHRVYEFHMIVFWICIAIGALVFAVLTYSLLQHRKTRDAKTVPFHKSLKVEALWTLVPFLILVAMAIPATLVMAQMEDASSTDLTIKIVGDPSKQQYDYVDYGVRLPSNAANNALVVPIHKKIRFLASEEAAPHSPWMSALGIKKAGIPGFTHEAWATLEKPGIYRGECTSLCGKNNEANSIVVIAKTQTDFDHWLTQQRTV